MSFIKKASLSTGATKGGEEEKFEKRILLLGLDNAGKTSILFHLRDNEFRDTVPTVGLNIEHILYKRYSLTFWDVGGQATKLWKHYFDHIDAVIFVVDSSDEEKLILAKDELRRLLGVPLHSSSNTTAGASSQGATSSGSSSEGLGDVPFLLLYNKKDIPTAKTHEELSGRLDVELLRKGGEGGRVRQIQIQETSARSGAGIWEGLDRLVALFEQPQPMSEGDSPNKSGLDKKH